MKRIILVLITIFSLNAVTYASFPVTENPTEQLSVSNEIPSVSFGGASWGIAALCFGILGLLLPGVPLLGTCAIILGIIGLKKRGRGMAIAGLILGIIKFIIFFFIISLYIISAGTLGAAFGG